MWLISRLVWLMRTMYWQLHSGRSKIYNNQHGFFKSFFLRKKNHMICVSIRFPFNWKTIIGYVAAHCIILVYSLCMIQIISCTINLLIGSSLLLNAITKDIKEDLVSMDKNWKNNQNPVQIRENFAEIIKNRASAVQLSTKCR